MGSDKKKYVILRIDGLKKTKDIPMKGGVTTKGTSSDELESTKSSTNIKVQKDELEVKDLQTLNNDKTVLSFAEIMPVKLVHPLNNNNPVTSNEQNWGLEAIGANLSNYSGKSLKVAVLDTGIDENHEAFKNVNLEVKNFTNDVNQDIDGHGTHCAGIIFGGSVDNTAIGVATGIEKALIGKVLGQFGGSTDDILSAINWAVESGANIISMSLGIDFQAHLEYLTTQQGMNVSAATSMALDAYTQNINLYRTLSDYIYEKGRFGNPCILVGASGNESSRPNYEISTSPPALVDNIISVGAIDIDRKIADFSNSRPDVCAPGVDIVSANSGGGLTKMTGTSMATPYVAGVACLWAEKLINANSFTTRTLKGNLMKSCVTQGLNNYNLNQFGDGLVQAPQS